MRALILSITLTFALLAPSVAHAGTSLIGDLDGDCSVSIMDLSLVAKRFGYSRGSLNYVAAYDLDHDGRISIFDIQRVAAHFGETC